MVLPGSSPHCYFLISIALICSSSPSILGADHRNPCASLRVVWSLHPTLYCSGPDLGNIWELTWKLHNSFLRLSPDSIALFKPLWFRHWTRRWEEKKSLEGKGLTTNVVNMVTCWCMPQFIGGTSTAGGNGSWWFTWPSTDNLCFCWKGNPSTCLSSVKHVKILFYASDRHCYWLKGTVPPEWRVAVGALCWVPKAWAARHIAMHNEQSDRPLTRAAVSGSILIKVILFTACLEMLLWVEKFTSGSFQGLSPFLPFPLHIAQRHRFLLNGK